MSNVALNHVWKTSKAKGSALLVMIAIADMANDEGDCWPGRTNLAKKCRVSKRYLQKLTAGLADLGELEIIPNDGIETKHGKTNRYRVTGVIRSSPHSPDGVIRSSPLGVIRSSPDPLVEPSVKKQPSDSSGLQYDQPIGPELCQPKDIVDAWYSAMPTPPIKRKYSRNVAVAKRIQDAGYTYDQVKRLTEYKYSTGRTAQVKLEYIEDDLPQWVAAGEKDNERTPNTSARRQDSKRGRRTRTPEQQARLKAAIEDREAERAAKEPGYKAKRFEDTAWGKGLVR